MHFCYKYVYMCVVFIQAASTKSNKNRPTINNKAFEGVFQSNVLCCSIASATTFCKSQITDGTESVNDGSFVSGNLISLIGSTGRDVLNKKAPVFEKKKIIIMIMIIL